MTSDEVWEWISQQPWANGRTLEQNEWFNPDQLLVWADLMEDHGDIYGAAGLRFTGRLKLVYGPWPYNKGATKWWQYPDPEPMVFTNQLPTYHGLQGGLKDSSGYELWFETAAKAWQSFGRWLLEAPDLAEKLHHQLINEEPLQ